LFSALSRGLRDKWRGYVLNLLASALGARRMRLVVFGEVFDMLERFAALLATILVSRHGSPPARVLHVLAEWLRERCAAL
jgi:hypothetical protein